MPDPAVIAQWLSGGVGIGVGIVAAILKRRLSTENSRRPLFENGERDEITKMIRQLRGSLRELEDDVAELRRESQDGARIHRKLIERLEALEGK